MAGWTSAGFDGYAKGALFRDATAELIGDGLFAAAGAVPGAEVAAEGGVDVELLVARQRVEQDVVVVVRVPAAAREREAVVAVELERVEESVAAPRAGPRGRGRVAALEELVRVRATEPGRALSVRVAEGPRARPRGGSEFFIGRRACVRGGVLLHVLPIGMG